PAAARKDPGMALGLAAPRPSRPELVAPVRHTAVLVAIFLAAAIGGARFQQQASAHPASSAAHPPVVPLYLSLIALEWGLVLFVWRGVRQRPGITLRGLVGGRWATPRDVVADAAMAVALWGLWSVLVRGWDRVLTPGHAASIGDLLPR